MSDQNITSDYPEVVEGDAFDFGADDSDPEDTSFDISLHRAGEEGGFHTANDPRAPYQRGTVTERRGPVDIRCKSREVVHGELGPDSDDFASLLVYDFYFDANKRFRRVAWANITFEFSSSEAGAPAPEIHSIAPYGRYSLLPTTQEETYKRKGGVKADAGQMGVSLGGSYNWSKSVNRTTNDDTRVVGASVCDKYGKEVGVNWAVHENETTKSGVPSFLRTAIVLKRKQDNKFQCAVKIDVESDWKTEMTRFFGSKGKDDPILFDPELPPTNNLSGKYDTENLGSINVEDLFDITFQTNFGNALKTQA